METTTNQFADTAKVFLSDILSKMGFTVSLSAAESDGVVAIKISTDKDELLTGKTSEPLLALQHLLRIMLRTAFPDTVTSVSLNVGDYQERQLERLRDLAKTAAAQARDTNLAVYLPNMSSYERRLVHMIIGEETGVVSESEGAGANRRIIVKPQA